MNPLHHKIVGWFARRHIFYGWSVVLVCFVVISLLFSVRLSFGLFFETFVRDAFRWGRGETAGVFSLTMLIAAVAGVPIGWLLDRFGARRVFLGGQLVLVSGLLLTSRMTSLWQFYVFYGLWAGLGIAALALPVQATTISRWFAQAGRRGLAIGLAFSGTGIGVVALVPVLERVIALHGWRAGYLLLAALLGGIALPLTWLFLQDSPYAVGLMPDGITAELRTPTASSAPTQANARTWRWREAAATSAFWLVLLASALSLFTLRMVTVHQVAYFVDRGISRRVAATVFGSTGLITAFSFVLFGRLSDRVGRPRAFHVGAAFQAAALVLLLNLRATTSFPLLVLYALLWGIGEGSRTGLLTAIASDLFPGPALGAIVGSIGAMFGIGAALGSWLGGAVYDWSGSYVPAFSAALVATLLASACVEAGARMAQAQSRRVDIGKGVE